MIKLVDIDALQYKSHELIDFENYFKWLNMKEVSEVLNTKDPKPTLITKQVNIVHPIR